MLSINEILEQLKALGRTDQLVGMSRYGMSTKNRLGVSIPNLRKMAKEVGKNHDLSLKLWDSGFQEARILASMVDDPEKVTDYQMEIWVNDFNSWDVCDQVCMNLFEKVSFIREKIESWSRREEEFVKRSAFTLIACIVWHDKSLSNEEILDFVPMIKRGAEDDRNYVKKAVSWALRHIGKRNLYLNREAIRAAESLSRLECRPARWIMSDVLRELKSEKIQQRFNKE